MTRLADSLAPAIALIARVLMASLFLMAAASNIGDLKGFAEFLEKGGVPGALAGPVFYFQFFGGIGLLLGYQTRLIGLAFAGFCITSGIWFYRDYSDPVVVTLLLKNIALTGGYLFVFLYGPGPISLDARLSR
ncbi:MAG: DoxX family protein [Paracoccaceae bacterium]